MRLIDADALKEEMDMSWCPDMAVSEIWKVIDKAPTVGGWTSVKDKLPERLCICLGYGCGEYAIVHMGNNGWMQPYLTHWMPLPEPPKEGGEVG